MKLYELKIPNRNLPSEYYSQPRAKKILYKITSRSCHEVVSHKSKNKSGYSLLRYRGKQTYLHRLVYEINFGEIGDLFVCHKCDNKACINPDHLYAGTHIDNMRDGVLRHRFPQGEKRPDSKLTAQDIIQIRQLRGKVSQRKLAEKYGVSNVMISKIQLKKRWKHVDFIQEAS